jgi:hypothetical protein
MFVMYWNKLRCLLEKLFSASHVLKHAPGMDSIEEGVSSDTPEEEQMTHDVEAPDLPEFETIETLDTQDVASLLNLIKQQQEAYRMVYSRNVILFSELTEANLLLEKLMAAHPPADPCPEGPAA